MHGTVSLDVPEVKRSRCSSDLREKNRRTVPAVYLARSRAHPDALLFHEFSAQATESKMESKTPSAAIHATIIEDEQGEGATAVAADREESSNSTSSTSASKASYQQPAPPTFPRQRGPAVEVTKLLSFAGERFRASVRDQPDSEGLPGVRLTIVPAGGGSDGAGDVEWYTVGCWGGVEWQVEGSMDEDEGTRH